MGIPWAQGHPPRTFIFCFSKAFPRGTAIRTRLSNLFCLASQVKMCMSFHQRGVSPCHPLFQSLPWLCTCKECRIGVSGAQTSMFHPAFFVQSYRSQGTIYTGFLGTPCSFHLGDRDTTLCFKGYCTRPLFPGTLNHRLPHVSVPEL